MNLTWVAALAGFILIEKAVARGPWPSRIAGAAAIGWGLVLLHRGLTS
jgi:predicted metal-binding membrane protein